MKTACPGPDLLQDLLDGLLEAREAERIREHLRECRACTEELAAYRRVFEAIEMAPEFDPGPGFTERVLAIVVPGRARRRWLRTVGWTYAGSLAASLAAASIVWTMPGTASWLDSASTVASRQMVQLAMFVLNALGFAALGVANGWGALIDWVARLAPLSRAMGFLLSRPPVEVALWSASLLCIAVLWRLHGRQRGTSRRFGPLGLLGV